MDRPFPDLGSPESNRKLLRVSPVQQRPLFSLTNVVLFIQFGHSLLCPRFDRLSQLTGQPARLLEASFLPSMPCQDEIVCTSLFTTVVSQHSIT